MIRFISVLFLFVDLLLCNVRTFVLEVLIDMAYAHFHNVVVVVSSPLSSSGQEISMIPTQWQNFTGGGGGGVEMSNDRLWPA